MSDDYDEQKVSTLKATLLEALKSAANIRALAPDDYITVCVSGAPVAVSTDSQPRTAGGGIGGGGLSGYGSGIFGGGGGVVAADVVTRGSVLALRVKKSDVDAFASGKLSPDEFSQAVTSTTYQTRSGSWSGDSYFQPGAGFDPFYRQPSAR